MLIRSSRTERGQRAHGRSRDDRPRRAVPFGEILERAKSRPVLQVNEDTVTVAQMIDYVRRRLLLEDRPVRLRSLLQHTRSRSALIAAFLALLEMVRLQAILVRQDKIFGDIVIKKHTMFDTVAGEDNTAVRDDWK